ncbi:hypothetical protein ACGFI9_14785 [Micromonospora sp. NPDC048930]|uniref:hypothetical protein n=1 Tax=Micromonospora sp. NPDC048930 TaxID=3364261 RepID=UPI0037119A7A
MNVAGDEDIRRLLTSHVPELPGPEDRLAEVARRVRRHRRRTVLGSAFAAVAVLLAIGLPVLVTDRRESAPPAAPATCPEPGPPPPATASTPGPLLPTDATRILVCEMVPKVDHPRPDQPGVVHYEAGWTRVVEREVPTIVAGLNALPEGRPGPRACVFAMLTHRYVLMVEHPGGVVRVDVDRCGPAVSGSHTREGVYAMIPQLRDDDPGEARQVIDPRTYPAPGCRPYPADWRDIARPPQIGTAWTGRIGDPLMPDPYQVARGCRYVDGKLVAQPVLRAGTDGGALDRLRSAAAADLANGGSTSPVCGGPGTAGRKTLDVLLVVGPTGTYGTISVERDRCTVRAWLGTAEPAAVPVRSIAALDQILGTPGRR